MSDPFMFDPTGAFDEIKLMGLTYIFRKSLQHNRCIRLSQEPLREWIQNELGLEGTLAQQLWEFRNLLPNGCHLTADERIDALDRKFAAIGRPDILTRGVAGLSTGKIRRIQRGLIDYGFAPPNMHATGEWKEKSEQALQNFCDFCEAWEEHRPK